MIDTLQREYLTEKLLQKLYLLGKTPRLADIRSFLARELAGKVAGEPLFSPRMVASTQVVEPEVLRNNASEIKTDLETLYLALIEILETEAITFGGVSGELQQLRHRLTKLREDLGSYLQMESQTGRAVLFDNFRDSSKIDLEQTTAFVNTTGGTVTLPVDRAVTIRYSPKDMIVVKETPGPNVILQGSPFSGVFSDYSDRVWQAIVPEGSSFVVEINITGGDVIRGHMNEVELNRIYIEPLTPLYLTVETSTDRVNWTVLVNQRVASPEDISIEPIWTLYLRFTVRGSGMVGIRKVELGRVGTVEAASLYSKALVADTSLYSLLFRTVEETPHGTSITHYISTTPAGPWSTISPGTFNLLDSLLQAETFTSAVADATTNLYRFDIASSVAIPESGELCRGIGQFKVEAFSFDWAKLGDAYHIPQAEDYGRGLGTPLTAYMGLFGSIDTIAPAEVSVAASSFIVEYESGGQTWWGVPLVDESGSVLVGNYNYRIRTWLYSDRDIEINNAGGGVYALSGSFTGVHGFGWALSINGLRIAYDNTIFVVADIPGSGDLTASTGKSFPIHLKSGWNKIELMLYTPDDTTLGGAILTQPMALLLRPSIPTFTLPSQYAWAYVPKQNEYTLWADGAAMARVSEFYLKWNICPLDRDFWAWKISPASGTPSSVMLNYDPADTQTTIDGKFYGSGGILQIKYLKDYSPTTTIYYRADLKRIRGTPGSPVLRQYEFISRVRPVSG